MHGQWSHVLNPNLRDLMPDDLRWSWHHNNRNKVHNKCHVLESSPDHPPWRVHGKIVLHKTGPCAKKVGDCCSRGAFSRFSLWKRCSLWNSVDFWEWSQNQNLQMVVELSGFVCILGDLNRFIWWFFSGIKVYQRGVYQAVYQLFQVSKSWCRNYFPFNSFLF